MLGRIPPPHGYPRQAPASTPLHPSLLGTNLRCLFMDTIKDRTEPSRRIENFFGGEGGGCPKGADQYDSSVPPPLHFFYKNYFLPSGVFGMIKYLARNPWQSVGCKGGGAKGNPTMSAPFGKPPPSPHTSTLTIYHHQKLFSWIL